MFAQCNSSLTSHFSENASVIKHYCLRGKIPGLQTLPLQLSSGCCHLPQLGLFRLYTLSTKPTHFIFYLQFRVWSLDYTQSCLLVQSCTFELPVVIFYYSQTFKLCNCHFANSFVFVRGWQGGQGFAGQRRLAQNSESSCFNPQNTETTDVSVYLILYRSELVLFWGMLGLSPSLSDSCMGSSRVTAGGNLYCCCFSVCGLFFLGFGGEGCF